MQGRQSAVGRRATLACPRCGLSPMDETAWICSAVEPGEGLEETLRTMAGRKWHSAEAIVRKLRRADERAAARAGGEDIAAELGIFAATSYNWRRSFGGMDTDVAKEVEELRERTSGCSGWSRMLSWRRTRCGRSPREAFDPGGQAAGGGHAPTGQRIPERFACRVIGVHRSTFRRLPAAHTAPDPDLDARAWLREYARENPRYGFGRARAALRFEECSGATANGSTGCGSRKAYRPAHIVGADVPGPRRHRLLPSMRQRLCRH